MRKGLPELIDNENDGEPTPRVKLFKPANGTRYRVRILDSTLEHQLLARPDSQADSQKTFGPDVGTSSHGMAKPVRTAEEDPWLAFWDGYEVG
jgi:hypothetical protein